MFFFSYSPTIFKIKMTAKSKIFVSSKLIDKKGDRSNFIMIFLNEINLCPGFSKNTKTADIEGHLFWPFIVLKRCL